MNRLARERSPYLLQHASNPVDWYPWGDEAFARARHEDKPIFLSIGYSTCHWCHVMEHESFEDEAIAERAQPRLRVDQGRSRGAAGRRSRLHGVRAGDDRLRRLADDGLSDAGSEAVLRRHLLSARRRDGAGPGFADLLGELARVWKEDRARVDACRRRAVRSAAARRQPPRRQPASRRRSRDAEALDVAVEQFQSAFDARHGGFGEAPKFPRPSELLFLLREHARRRRRPRRAGAAADGGRDAARHGARRHARPRRRRLPSLLGGRRLARAAFREDALRPGAAGARVSRGGAGDAASRSSSTSPRTRWRTCCAT